MTNLNYIVTTPNPIRVVVDADSTSATISWQYTCSYGENECKTYVINGSESQIIELTPNTSCDEKITNGTISWNGNDISYNIIQRPYTTEKPTDYVISTIGGKDVEYNQVSGWTLGCGEGYEKELPIVYSSITYTSSCDEEGNSKSGETKMSFVFDCSDMESGGSVSAETSIFNQDITYIYKCKKCEGIKCLTSQTIDENTIELIEFEGETITEDNPLTIPCSGVSDANGKISFTVKKILTNCDEELILSSATVNNITVPKCADSKKCCRPHSAVGTGKTSYGETVYLSFSVEKGDGECYTGCSDTCDAENEATLSGSWSANVSSTTSGYGWYSDDFEDGRKISDIPIFVYAEEPYTIILRYQLNYAMYTTACTLGETGTVINVHTETINLKKCPKYIYDIETSGLDTSSCNEQTPTFTVRYKPKTFPIDGSGARITRYIQPFEIQKFYKEEEPSKSYDIIPEYPTIDFYYGAETCKK